MPIVSRFTQLFKAQVQDLPLFALIQAAFLAVGLVAAKFYAVSHAFDGAPFGDRVRVLPAVLPFELLAVGVFCVLALAARRLPPLKPALRWIVFVALNLLVLLWLFAAFANVEFYTSFGTPLRYHLVQMAQGVGQYLLLSGLRDKMAGLIAAAFLALAALLLAPLLHHRLKLWLERRGPALGAWTTSLATCVVGVGLLLIPPQGFRERALREMTVFNILLPEADQAERQMAPPSAAERALLARLCGPERREGLDAFAKLPRKKMNVVLWVWESVSERYLTSFPKYGVAKTPHLDRIMANGAVRFSQCYSESPLTVQAGWSLLTGYSPPARPIIFMKDTELPKHGPVFPALLKDAGYRTSAFNASNPKIWDLNKILAECKFDALEDQEEFKRRKNAVHFGWGVNDELLPERFFEWLGETPQDKPFFSMLWTIRPHHPYSWPEMPKELVDAPPLTRYIACIESSDQVLGQFYDDLVKRQLADDTLLIVVGDHGEGMGRHPRPYDRSHSMLVFEDDIHVPLIFIHPALKGAASEPIDLLCHHADLYPTIMDLLGLQVPDGLHGRSLARAVQPEPFFARSIAWWPVCVRAGQYKLRLDAADAQPELHDLAADPREEHDLSSREPEITSALTAAIFRMTEERFRTDPSFKFGFSIIPSDNVRKGGDDTPKLPDLLVPTEKR